MWHIKINGQPLCIAQYIIKFAKCSIDSEPRIRMFQTYIKKHHPSLKVTIHNEHCPIDLEYVENMKNGG